MKLGTQFRSFEVNRENIDKEKRTVELSFSSEAPVERWFGNEILDHSKGSVRLQRLKTGGPLLQDHDSRQQIGVIESVEIDPSQKKGRAVVRFSKNAKAEEVFNDVLDGIRQNVSVGYQVHKFILEKEEEGVSTYRATDWEPLEISLVSVPADISVGVGREQDRAGNVREVEVIKQKREEVVMPEVVDIEKERNQAREAEQKRTAEILALGEKHNCAELARKAITEGTKVEDFRAEVLEKVYKAREVSTTETPEIGLSKKEIRRYSIIRAINAMANPNDAKLRNAAAFELECAEVTAKKLGRQARGLFIPRDIQTAQLGEAANQMGEMQRLLRALLTRDLTKGTGSAGGYTVATDLLESSFIDLLRNRMMVLKMGATVLGGLVGDVAIPRQSGGATAYWVGENSAPTESQQTFEQIGMTPKTVGAFTDISRKLLVQSSLDVEAFVRVDLAKVLALAIDLAAIKGLGSAGEPLGILNTTGIGSVAGGTDGLAPTWANVVALETAVANANADLGTLGYLTNSKVRGKLKTTEKASNTAQFIWGDMSGEPGMGMLNGYRAGVSNQVPSNLTKGSSGAVCSAIIFGNWADLIVAEWGVLDLLVDPYTGGAAGTVRVRVLQETDVALRHPESFASMQDALTT